MIPRRHYANALLFAARDGFLDSGKLLIDAGADIDKAEANAITPLLMAVQNNQTEVAHLLIERKARRR